MTHWLSTAAIIIERKTLGISWLYAVCAKAAKTNLCQVQGAVQTQKQSNGMFRSNKISLSKKQYLEEKSVGDDERVQLGEMRYTFQRQCQGKKAAEKQLLQIVSLVTVTRNKHLVYNKPHSHLCWVFGFWDVDAWSISDHRKKNYGFFL